MLRFRKLKSKDIEQRDWHQEPLTALLPAGSDFISQHFAQGDTLIVLFDDEKPVGLLEMDAQPVGEKPRCAVIGLTVLLPEYRRRGLGRMLMVLAADTAVSRQLWFLAGRVPHTAEAEGFAKAIHMKPTAWFEDMHVLDLSDVEGLRYGQHGTADH